MVPEAPLEMRSGECLLLIETSDPKEAYARFGDDKPVACPPAFPG